MTVAELIPTILAYYRAKPENATGGALHIVLDDGNVEDHSVQFCRDFAREQGDAEGERLAGLLLELTKDERRQLSRENFYPWDNPC